MTDELDAFIIDIIDTKQLPGLTDEVKTELVADLKQRLLDEINRTIVTAMPDDKIDLLNDAIDEGKSDEEVQKIMLESGVDVETLTIETMMGFRDLYLQDAEERKG